MFIIRTVLVFIICKYNKQSVKDNIDFDLIPMTVEGVTFILIISLVSWVLHNYANSPLLMTIAIILMISFIPSYNFLINPLQYLFLKKKYYTDENLERLLSEENNGYNIRIIKGNVDNAYATGILPHTKIILIGEKLIKNMTPCQIQGILFHEIGHLKYKHLNKLYLVNLFLSAIFYFLFLLRYKISELNESLFMEYFSVFIVGVSFGILIWYIPGKIQYKLELQADAFAASIVGNEHMISMLEKLDKITNGRVSKGSITHPKLEKRIENISKLQR